MAGLPRNSVTQLFFYLGYFMVNDQKAKYGMKKALRKITTLVVAVVFLSETLLSGFSFAESLPLQKSTLSTWTFNEQPQPKREMVASMYRKGRLIWVANSERYLDLLARYNALALLLPSGRYLMAPETAGNDLSLIRGCAHEDVEILMQQEEKLHATRYERLKKQLLNDKSIMALYRKLSGYKDIDGEPDNIIFNDLIAKAFELLFVIDEHLVYPNTELSREEREFIKLMRPVLEAKDSRGRYKNFSQVFFDADRRTKAIQALQEDKNERFYRVASAEAGAILTPKVYGEAVGVFRLIPDIVTNYRALWDLKDNEIVGVDFYPTADPTFSRPMAIVTSGEMAGLSHAEVRARYWRIPHAQTQDLNALKKFDGKWIYIKVTEAGVELRLATKEEITNYESYKPRRPTPKLEEANLATKASILDWTQATDPKEVSHKFSGLHTAYKAQTYGAFWERRDHPSFYIHWGSVIPYATYKRVLDANPGVEQRIRSLVARIDNNDIDDIKRKLSQIREIIVSLNIPDDIWGDAEKERGSYGAHSIDYTVMNETYNGSGVFVRTGTNAEDLPDYPGFGAGQYGTFPNVLRKDVKTAVKMAWASIWNEGAYIDRMKVGVDHFAVYPAVQITKAIDAEYAFVVHTADPNGQDKDKVYIEIVQGLGEGLVGDKYPGEAHRYVYSKSQDKIIQFDAATKKEKAVLNPEGGLSRAPSDYSNDIFAHDGVESAIALDIARQAVAIEKAAGRPQDIEGAIEYNDYRQEHRWMVTQSRSEVGYDRAPTSWEEYFKANREWALAFMAKHNKVLSDRVPSYSFKSDVQEMLKQEISTSQDERIVGDKVANKLRLFYSFGDEGRRFAGRILICGAGIHRELQNALGRLPLQMCAGIIAHAAIDYEMLDREALEDFEHTSNYNLARIIVVHDVAAWRDIFKQVSPRNLAFLIAEVIAFHHKPKADWEQADIKDFSWNEFRKVVREIYDQYDFDQQEEFSGYLSREAAMNIGGLSREEPQHQLSSEDREKLLEWRYYKKPQAIVLSASSIDGCIGLSSFFFSLRFSFGRGEEERNPFHFFILMDIPNERPEDFLRRNGLVGRDFTAVLIPSEIKAENILWHINNPINRNLPDRGLLKGDSIVFVGPEETIRQYGTEENEVLILPVSAQRGQIPLVIADAIRLLTKTHKDKEGALSAWLTSRGLDGTKRYHEWVYQAERFLETYEQLDSRKANAAEFNEKLFKPFTTYVEKGIAEVASGRDYDKSFSSSVDYLEKKNPDALHRMLYFATIGLWSTKREELVKFYRSMGADFIRNFNTWFTGYPALTKEELALYSKAHDTDFREFIKKEASFPRNTSSLERLLTDGTDMPAFIAMLTEMHQYYVVDGHEDAGFTRKDAEACVFHAMQHRREFYGGYGSGDQHNLSATVSQRQELRAWFSEIAKQHDRVVVSGDQLSEGGSSDTYIMMTKSDFRAAQRRVRAEKGEDVDYSACSDSDFTIGAVQDGIKYVKMHYDLQQEDKSFDTAGRTADYAESSYRSFHYTDAFHAIYDPHGYGRDFSHAQDLIEFMCYVDRDRIAQRRNLGPADNMPASMEIILYAVLRAKSEDMAKILSGVSPTIIADLIHYAAMGYRNEQITEQYLLRNQPQAKAILRKLLESQSDVRRPVIERQLSAEAREFLAKKAEPVDAKKAERERRKELMRRAKENPPGSIYGIFKYLCDHGITSADNAVSGELLAKFAGEEHEARQGALSFESIKDDLRGLLLHLHLIEKAPGTETGKDARYYVPESVKKKGAEILPILEQFRGRNLRPKVVLLDQVYEGKIKPILGQSMFGNHAISQRLIPMNTPEIPPMEQIGEKAYKLLKMAQAGLNVPPFFIIATDGSGQITVTDDLKRMFDGIHKPAIVRSTHRAEGTVHPFSGVFDSYGGITTIEPTDTEIVDPESEEFWDEGPKPESLISAYRLILEGATEGNRVKKYLEDHNITEFNPNQMNAVVMEEVDIDVFGMFMTSSQNNPDEVLIHYQVRHKGAAEKVEPERDSFGRLKEKGGVITYNRRTQQLGQNDLDEQTRDVLRQFGNIAGQIEAMFGVQQIELAASKGKVYVLQSRNINLSDPRDVPRLAHYQTMDEDLHAIGYGYYHLPILVIDTLEHAHPKYRETAEYRKLHEAYMASGKQWQGPEWDALEKYTDDRNNEYREELRRFQAEHPEYILVIKDASAVMDHGRELFSGKDYGFLNELASKAKVVVRGRNQNAIRHEDWQNVELGALTIIPPEASGWGGFIHDFVCTREANDPGSREIFTSPSRKRENVSIQRVGRLQTGDSINVLSNIDGVFVWVGNPLTGGRPAPTTPSPSDRPDAGAVKQAFDTLNNAARKVSQMNSEVSKLRGTSQKLSDVTKYRFCVPVSVLKNSPDITLALNTTGLLKRRDKDSEKIEFELVVTGVTDEDISLIEGLNRDDIRKALDLPEKFTVTTITERQMQETASRFSYDIANPKHRVAIVKDFFSGTLANGEYMAIATDALGTEDDADKLQADIEREFKQELSQENISIRVLVGPERDRSMFSLSKIINDWLDAINQGNLSSIAKILPIPAPLTPELERAIRHAWAVLTAA